MPLVLHMQIVGFLMQWLFSVYFRCSTIVNRFLDLDLDTADIKSFFDDLVLPTVEKEQ